MKARDPDGLRKERVGMIVDGIETRIADHNRRTGSSPVA